MASLNDCFETENPPTYNREFTGQKSTELFRGVVGGDVGGWVETETVGRERSGTAEAAELGRACSLAPVFVRRPFGTLLPQCRVFVAFPTNKPTYR